MSYSKKVTGLAFFKNHLAINLFVRATGSLSTEDTITPIGGIMTGIMI